MEKTESYRGFKITATLIGSRDGKIRCKFSVEPMDDAARQAYGEKTDGLHGETLLQLDPSPHNDPDQEAIRHLIAEGKRSVDNAFERLKRKH